ncbi:MAG: FAD-dependent monooxygenase [Betaproteobacteria bacterium]
MSAESDTCWDALIIGGGPSGATAAILLARRGWRVAIAEKKLFPRRKVCGEFVSATTWPLLRKLGVADLLSERAGPEVRRVGLYAAHAVLGADMPSPRNALEGWGRAIGREHLDTQLLERAVQTGARLLQPCAISSIDQDGPGYVCSGTIDDAAGSDGPRPLRCRARIVIAAHGSWETGVMPTQSTRQPLLPADLFAFKAHFRSAGLPMGTMPLLVFPHGYGGMVQSGGGRVSLSCCIRRDALEKARRVHAGTYGTARAADAVLAHIRATCRGVREALSGATLEGAWLSAGPIRPGMRRLARGGIFAVGNAAGEAHPIVAEGISMAIQSSWLLCDHLVPQEDALLAGAPHARSSALAAVARGYRRGWRDAFVTRIHAASLFAQVCMRPGTAALAVALLQTTPAMLTLGARLSGKARSLRPRGFGARIES